MTILELIRFGLKELRRKPLSMMVATAAPHALGLVFLFTFNAGRSSTVSDPIQEWRSFSSATKLLFISAIAINSWVPFALGQAGISSIVAAHDRGQQPDSREVFDVIL